MILTDEQGAILNGEKGETMAKVMESVVRYGELFGAEEKGRQNDCQKSAINKGKSFIAHRVVRSGQELVEEIHQVKLPFKLPFKPPSKHPSKPQKKYE